MGEGNIGPDPQINGEGSDCFFGRNYYICSGVVVTGSAIGQSLLGSGKGVGQSGPFTVGNGPCDGCCGDYKMLCEFIGSRQRKKGGFRSMSFCVRLKSGLLSA